MKNKGCNTRKDNEFSRLRPWLGLYARMSLHSVNWKRLCDHKKASYYACLKGFGNRAWVFMFSNFKSQISNFNLSLHVKNTVAGNRYPIACIGDP